jgi:uncharacterized protein Yka (UPF0111/DUF47 family)
MDITYLSIIIGTASIVLAAVAILFSVSYERRSAQNFKETQEIMRSFEDRSKVLLSDVDKKAAIIEKVVQKNQDQMMDTLLKILTETLIPQQSHVIRDSFANFVNNLSDKPENMQMLFNLLKDILRTMKSYYEIDDEIAEEESETLKDDKQKSIKGKKKS